MSLNTTTTLAQWKLNAAFSLLNILCIKFSCSRVSFFSRQQLPDDVVVLMFKSRVGQVKFRCALTNRQSLLVSVTGSINRTALHYASHMNVKLLCDSKKGGFLMYFSCISSCPSSLGCNPVFLKGMLYFLFKGFENAKFEHLMPVLKSKYLVEKQ